MDRQGKKPIIVVIGAGVSGLSCAHHLTTESPEDCEVIVLEGRDRIGGRTWTKQFGNAPVDLGASWVHGTQGNPVAELAPKIGLELYQKKEDFQRIQATVAGLNLPTTRWVAWDEKGNDLTSALVSFEDAFTQMAESLEHESTVLQKKNNLELPDVSCEDALLEKSVKSGFQDKWKQKLGEEIYQRAWNWRIQELESYFNTPLYTMSLRWYEDGKEEIGGNRHTINGYGVLVQYLAKQINIQTNRKVKSIVKTEDNKITITDTKGQSILADYVVCTIPLGVLKKEEVLFQPKLSEKKETAIKNLGMGFLNKVVLHFSAVFWPPQVGWISFIGGSRDQFGDIKSLFKKTGEPVLVFYLAPGVSIKRQKEGWTEEETLKRCLTILSYQFGDKPTQLFLSGFATEWQNDPFSYGSYSYLALGSSGHHYDWLSEPEYDQRLLFAGEATERNSPATVEGAFVSGRREANRIQNLLNKHK